MDTEEEIKLLSEQVARLTHTVETMARWLAQTPGVWGEKDYEGIMKILKGEN